MVEGGGVPTIPGGGCVPYPLPFPHLTDFTPSFHSLVKVGPDRVGSNCGKLVGSGR